MMYDRSLILDEINDLINVLDPDEYPETFEYLSLIVADIAAEESEELPSAYDLATSLARCDERETMHTDIFDFLVELYECEIENDNEHAMNGCGVERLGRCELNTWGCGQLFGAKHISRFLGAEAKQAPPYSTLL